MINLKTILAALITNRQTRPRRQHSKIAFIGAKVTRSKMISFLEREIISCSEANEWSLTLLLTFEGSCRFRHMFSVKKEMLIFYALSDF